MSSLNITNVDFLSSSYLIDAELFKVSATVENDISIKDVNI